MSDGSDPRHADPEGHERRKQAAAPLFPHRIETWHAIDDVRGYHADKIVADAVALTKGPYGVPGKVRPVQVVSDGKAWHLIDPKPIEVSRITRKEVADAAYAALTPQQQALLQPKP